MDEQNQAGPPQRYIWPRYVLSGVVLGIVLAIIWMAVLVHRIREQREDMTWPTNVTKAAVAQSNQSAAMLTNSVPATNSTLPRP
jgi:hypothetical protein